LKSAQRYDLEGKTTLSAYNYLYNGKELQDEMGLEVYDFHTRYYDAVIGRFMSQDPMAHVRSWVSPYNFVQNNPITRVDPTGALDAPIYDTEGEFLGTDDQGLQGKAIVMNKDDFSQGMSHDDALSKSLGAEGLSSDAAKTKLLEHKAGLKDRPDWDGFVTIDEGIQWAKDHPNTLPDNITPDNSLYLDASKLNYGNLSVDNIGLNEGQKGNVNLFDYVRWTSSSSRATSYALGNTQVRLQNADAGAIKLFWDDYNWDYHSYPPTSTRDRLIYLERKRAGVNDSHGFRVFMFGTGTIKK